MLIAAIFYNVCSCGLVFSSKVVRMLPKCVQHVMMLHTKFISHSCKAFLQLMGTLRVHCFFKGVCASAFDKLTNWACRNAENSVICSFMRLTNTVIHDFLQCTLISFSDMAKLSGLEHSEFV